MTLAFILAVATVIYCTITCNQQHTDNPNAITIILPLQP